ncbi:hypothetical protein EYR38_009161 [Pleurotus pulmonarius]|nr:hypothetical protein EYR38_009161 [Pleurotus pulmonarius]
MTLPPPEPPLPPEPTLPPELWMHILSYLPQSDLLQARLVNWTLCDIGMDLLRLYEHCTFPFDSPGFELLRAEEPWLAKRMKSVEISTSSLFDFEALCETLTPPITPAHPPPERKTTRKSRVWGVLVWWTRARGAPVHPPQAEEDAPMTPAGFPPNSAALRVLDALSAAENLQKATLRFSSHDHLADEVLFARSLFAVLYSPGFGATAHGVSQFEGYPLRLFFRALAASLEALSIMSNRDDVASHISDILSDQVAGTLVPKLRELTFYALIRNPGTLEGIGLNFPALRKLKMWPITIVASSPPPSLETLQLPELHTLEMWFQHPNMLLPFPYRSSTGLPRLETFHLLTEHIPKTEVSRICTFWKGTGIARLLLKVEILNGELIGLLAAAFPVLRDLTLYARHFIRPGLERETYVRCFSFILLFI